MAPRAARSGSADQGGLVARAAAGDSDAQRQVFDSQRPMLNRLARARSDQGLPEEDLVQEGSVGLLAAIQQFAGTEGAEFDRFAEELAAAAMDAALRAESVAREREEQMVRDANAFAVAEIRLKGELGRAPRVGELATHLEWSVDRVEEVAGAVAEARENDDQDLLRYLAPDEILELLEEEDGDDA